MRDILFRRPAPRSRAKLTVSDPFGLLEIVSQPKPPPRPRVLYGQPLIAAEARKKILRRLVTKRVHSSPAPSGVTVNLYRDGSLDAASQQLNVQSNLAANRFNNAGTEVEQTRVTHRAKKRIRLASRLYNHGASGRRNIRRRCSFITLTFGREWPGDKEAKGLLDVFLKAFRRKAAHDHIAGFHYLWVMELQKRGAPHFHLLTPHYLAKSWVNNTWNRIVSRWQRESGSFEQEVYPEIAAVRWDVEKYMTKYLSKPEHEEQQRPMKGRIWAISTDTRELMKPVMRTNLVSNGIDTSEVLYLAIREYQECYPHVTAWVSRYKQSAHVACGIPFIHILNGWKELLNFRDEKFNKNRGGNYHHR